MTSTRVAVLLAEGDPARARAITETLESGLSGAEVRVARTLDEFRKLAEEDSPDIALLDMALPGGHAADALSFPAEDGAFPILALVPCAADHATREAVDRGALDYALQSSRADADLPHAIQRALREWALIQKLRGAGSERNGALKDRQILLQAMGNPSLILDKNFTILEANRAICRLTGMTEEALRGQLCYRIFHRTDAPPNACPLARMKESGRFEVEEMEVAAFGRVFLVACTPVFGETGDLLRVIHIATDITDRKQARTAAEETLSQYRDLVENSSDLICTHDLKGVLLSVNAAAVKAAGFAVRDLVGHNLREILPRERWHELDVYLETITREKVAAGTMKVVSRTGGERYWEYRNTLRTEGVTEPVVRGMARDVTDTVLARKALRENADRFRSLYENASLGLYRTTRDGRILMANSALLRMLGYDSFEALSQRDLTKEGFEPSYPRQAFLDAMERDGEVRGWESEWRRRDGTTLFVRESARSTHDPSGKFLFYDGTVEDITDRKRSEEAQALLSATIEQSHEGVIITDPQGAILYSNMAMQKLSGYGREELLGQNPRILKSGLHDRAYYKVLWETVLSGGRWEGRMINRRRDGSLYTADMAVAPVRNSEGSISALLATQKDVTREVALEERLARGKSLETIGMVAGGLAHEIRNPLFAISTVSAALQKNFGANLEIAPYIGHIQEHVQRLSTLTSDLLTLGRPVPPENFTACGLLQVLNQVTANAEKAMPGSSDRIAVACEPEFFVMGIEAKLVQIVLNLVQNALSIAPDPTPVTVEVRRDGPDLEIEVADVGPGIPPTMLDRLFQPFTSRRQGGTGLGLAIVQKLTEAHGGTVTGQNRREGPGAVFTVRLPAALPPADACGQPR